MCNAFKIHNYNYSEWRKAYRSASLIIGRLKLCTANINMYKVSHTHNLVPENLKGQANFWMFLLPFLSLYYFQTHVDRILHIEN